MKEEGTSLRVLYYFVAAIFIALFFLIPEEPVYVEDLPPAIVLNEDTLWLSTSTDSIVLNIIYAETLYFK